MKVNNNLRKISYSLLTMTIFFLLTSNAYSQDQNYKRTIQYLSSSFPTSTVITTQYFDGLGRPIQTNIKGITPNGYDLVTQVQYDVMSNKTKDWLSLPVPGNEGDFIEPTSFIGNIVSNYSDSRPFNETIYESSPLNRPIRVFGAGNDWSVNNKSRKIDYQIDNGSVAYFYVNEQMQLAKGGYYAANMLFKTVSTDEDGKTSTEYKDKLGRVIMTRNSQNVDTYYVYNDLGQLMYVLPPIATDNINGTIGVGIIADSHTQLKLFGYLYKYDERGNCIFKRLPGCEPILMVYDKADRLVMSQDGEQRKSHEWSFIEYDVLGRVVQSGTTTVVISNEAELNALRESTSTILNVNNFNGAGYNTTSLGSNPIVLIENYYDNYQFINMSAYSSFSTRLSYSEVSGFDNQYIHPTTPAISAKGMLTGTMVRMLDNSAIEVTAMYYDDRGRVVQSRANNRLNGYDYDLYHYSFTGQVLNHRHVHKTSLIASELIENYRFVYDHADRLRFTFHKLNTRAEVKLSELVYDELGRVSQKILHSGGETIDYTYNIRNWTKSITSNRFSQTLYYQDALDGKPVYYNGNISAIKWGTGATQDKKYYFSYDGLNRMTYAAYSPDNIFDEKVDQYDKHGNILSLKRSGWVQDWSNEEPILGYVDYMTMTYNGNQLKNADDMVEEIFNQSPNDFYNVWDENIETEYLYDANGNQYADLNKGIAWIKYNLLNLPEKIQFQNGEKTEYLYDASGVKRQGKWAYGTANPIIPLGNVSQEVNNVTVYRTIEYCGNYIYEQGNIKRILTTEGYITTAGYIPMNFISQWRYNYSLRDYQGNTRQTLYGNMLSGSQNVLFASGSTVDYDPFGMEMTTPECYYTSGTNPYLYNGKEIDRMHGLNQYDYGARWRDGALPPWTTVDPLAEKYYSISPYAYCANNPVLFVDPDGRDWIVTNDTYKFEWRDGINANSMLPEGYSYVGSQNNDILSYMGIKTSYSDANTNTIGQVASDAELGKFAVSHAVNVKEKTSIDISTNVSINDNNKSEVNSKGRTFNGIDITVTNISSNSGVNGVLTSISTLTVQYGNEKANFVLKNPSYISLHKKGTSVTEGTAFVPAHILSPSSSFTVQVKGDWSVYNSGQRTPVVAHALLPVPISFSHKWNIK